MLYIWVLQDELSGYPVSIIMGLQCASTLGVNWRDSLHAQLIIRPIYFII